MALIVMDYFYVKPENVSHSSLTIRGDESKHLVRVLRKNVGDRIFVTDGNDTMYEAVITDFGEMDVHCDIAAIHRKYNEPSIDVTLAVSLLKNPARFDYLVEKITELGVRTIIPLLCQRTIPQHEKHSRLEKIAHSAMKQCGRSWLPHIQPLQTFEALVGNSQHWPFKFIPHEKADPLQTISMELKYHDDVHSLLIMIGPEGGFAEEEMTLALHSGFKPVSLGPRRLRTETAAVVTMTELLR
jgi:16S rRNA (uracil1498-N3)-methyltransferase